MSDTGFVSLEDVFTLPEEAPTTIFRVIAKNISVPLQIQNRHSFLEELENDVFIELLEPVTEMVQPEALNPIEQLLEIVLDDDGAYVPEPPLEVSFEPSEEDEPEEEFFDPTVKEMEDMVLQNLEKSRTARTADANKQAADKGSLQYLKSVEGRVLTVLEAAISNDSQREAVKSLIKKEFRREMNKVNRTPEEEE
jgi:hypothetical protein